MTDSHPLMTFEELKEACRGRWREIFSDLARDELDEALKADGKYHVSCPVHGGNDGFRLFRDFEQTGGGICNSCGGKASGFVMLAWLKGYTAKDATREIAQWHRGGAITPTAPVSRPPVAPKPPPDPAKVLVKLGKAWRPSLALKGTCAELYLENRGIWPENMPKVLRFHPGLDYYDAKTKKVLGTFPVMLAPVTNLQGELRCLHRTFLTLEGGKADVPEPKKLMQKVADLNGCAIKLYPSGEVLGVAEGIETALAVHAIARIPVWSCVSAPLMETVDIPPSVRHVVIWADLDRSGRGAEAAEKLAKRMVDLGKTVEIVMPQGPIPEGAKGIDWLDVLLTRGLEGFPQRWRNYRPPLMAPTVADRLLCA